MICKHHKRIELGYIQWHSFAGKLIRQRITQVKCTVCKLYLFPQEINEPENSKVIKVLARHQAYLEKHPNAKSLLHSNDPYTPKDLTLKK